MSVKLFESEILGVSLTSLVCKDGEIYFKAREVATALGYGKPADAIDRHVWGKNKFEWRVIQRSVIHGPLKREIKFSFPNPVSQRGGNLPARS